MVGGPPFVHTGGSLALPSPGHTRGGYLGEAQELITAGPSGLNASDLSMVTPCALCATLFVCAECRLWMPPDGSHAWQVVSADRQDVGDGVAQGLM